MLASKTRAVRVWLAALPKGATYHLAVRGGQSRHSSPARTVRPARGSGPRKEQPPPRRLRDQLPRTAPAHQSATGLALRAVTTPESGEVNAQVCRLSLLSTSQRFLPDRVAQALRHAADNPETVAYLPIARRSARRRRTGQSLPDGGRPGGRYLDRAQLSCSGVNECAKALAA